MILESLTLLHIAGPIASAIAAVVLYHYLGREYLGADENKYWNAARRRLLAGGDSYVRKKTNFALTNTASQEELVGTLDMSSDEFAHALQKAGYLQGVLSGLKERSNGDYESGSMVYRESKMDLLPDALALRQVHVFWFENDDGTIEVYAHEEYSSLNPLVSVQHYRAITQNPEKGKARVRSDLERVGISV